MAVTPFVEGRRMPAGGWKCTSLGASIWRCPGLRRHVAGATPYALVNARVNASWLPYPASGDVDQRRGGGDHAVRRPLEEDAPPERARRFAGHRGDDSVEVEAGEVEPAGQLLRRGVVVVERVGEDVHEGGEGVGGDGHGAILTAVRLLRLDRPCSVCPA
jgi:hypothetical protein